MNRIAFIAAGALTVAVFATTAAASAAAVSPAPASALHQLESAVVNHETFGIAHTTYVATVLPDSTGQTAFCAAWDRFGNGPTFRGVLTVHELAPTANKITRHDFGQFQFALISGNHKSTQEWNAAVWTDCFGRD